MNVWQPRWQTVINSIYSGIGNISHFAWQQVPINCCWLDLYCRKKQVRNCFHKSNIYLHAKLATAHIAHEAWAGFMSFGGKNNIIVSFAIHRNSLVRINGSENAREYSSIRRNLIDAVYAFHKSEKNATHIHNSNIPLYAFAKTYKIIIFLALIQQTTQSINRIKKSHSPIQT